MLQVGQPTNVMVQLNMTADEYNWVQSIYFVSSTTHDVGMVRLAFTNTEGFEQFPLFYIITGKKLDIKAKLTIIR